MTNTKLTDEETKAVFNSNRLRRGYLNLCSTSMLRMRAKAVPRNLWLNFKKVFRLPELELISDEEILKFMPMGELFVDQKLNVIKFYLKRQLDADRRAREGK